MELGAIDRTECLALLTSRNLGRVAFTERALPSIRPVNYALVGTHLLLRTSSTGLGRRLDGQVVAFEVDHLDEEGSSGWSVLVTGTARLLREPDELTWQDAVALVPLLVADRDACVCITPGQITGRRVGPVSAAAHAS